MATQYVTQTNQQMRKA